MTFHLRSESFFVYNDIYINILLNSNLPHRYYSNALDAYNVQHRVGNHLSVHFFSIDTFLFSFLIDVHNFYRPVDNNDYFTDHVDTILVFVLEKDKFIEVSAVLHF